VAAPCGCRDGPHDRPSGVTMATSTLFLSERGPASALTYAAFVQAQVTKKYQPLTAPVALGLTYVGTQGVAKRDFYLENVEADHGLLKPELLDVEGGIGTVPSQEIERYVGHRRRNRRPWGASNLYEARAQVAEALFVSSVNEIGESLARREEDRFRKSSR
jgi:hypothetical protein